VRTQLKIGIVAAIALTGAAISGIALAGAADPDLETRIDSARQEATLVTERISSQSARIAELERSAAAARAREQDLEAELAESRARSAELGDELAAAETELEAVRARYKRAVDVLAEHLVAIYKSSEPDYLTILLEADGYDDLATRTDYLDALTAEDDRVAARVADLHEQVAGRHSEITELKAEIDRQTEQLEGARAEIAELRAEDERRAVQLSAARAEARAALGELQDRISGWELEVRREAAEQLASGGGEAFLGGPYAIPTYIVICESGGNYGALNPSSGAGGAYQILPSTWHAYGGSGLPHQASKAEQDRIAAIIWRQDGPGAWSCA
jgi:septal ring factor EnvC (AmiA/AmiB activator)